MLKSLMKLAAVGAFLAFGLIGASALNVDQTRVPPARDYDQQQVAYYRLTLNYNDPRVGTAQRFGALPKGSYILSIDAYTTTAFNAGTTNPITIGVTLASSNEIVASGITNTSATTTHLTTAAGLGTGVTNNATYQNTYGDIPLYALYAPTGTAASAGSVTIVIAFVPNNDM